MRLGLCAAAVCIRTVCCRAFVPVHLAVVEIVTVGVLVNQLVDRLCFCCGAAIASAGEKANAGFGVGGLLRDGALVPIVPECIDRLTFNNGFSADAANLIASVAVLCTGCGLCVFCDGRRMLAARQTIRIRQTEIIQIECGGQLGVVDFCTIVQQNAGNGARIQCAGDIALTVKYAEILQTQTDIAGVAERKVDARIWLVTPCWRCCDLCGCIGSVEQQYLGTRLEICPVEVYFKAERNGHLGGIDPEPEQVAAGKIGGSAETGSIVNQKNVTAAGTCGAGIVAIAKGGRAVNALALRTDGFDFFMVAAPCGDVSCADQIIGECFHIPEHPEIGGSIALDRDCGRSCLVRDPKFIEVQTFGKKIGILIAFKIEIEFSDLAEIQIVISIKRNADEAFISRRQRQTAIAGTGVGQGKNAALLDVVICRTAPEIVAAALAGLYVVQPNVKRKLRLEFRGIDPEPEDLSGRPVGF